MSVLHFFVRPGPKIGVKSLKYFGCSVPSIQSEICFNVNSNGDLFKNEKDILKWLIAETFEPNNFSENSFLQPSPDSVILEFGPRLNFSSAFSSNSLTILNACGITKMDRVEKSRRFKITFVGSTLSKSPKGEDIFNLPSGEKFWITTEFLESLHDPMTEVLYSNPLKSFVVDIKPEPWEYIPVLKEGRKALEDFDKKVSLAFDNWDFDFYTKLFQEMKRDPTSVECFDLSQSNSEHSRHWFFGGRIVIDGQEMPHSLFKLVKDTLSNSKTNSTIAFSDNSSAIRGYDCEVLQPQNPLKPSLMEPLKLSYDFTFTAETHNFPTGIAPFPGAETGIGGRIRDGHSTGRGSLIIAGTSGYSVGNLHIPEYPLPWENSKFSYISSGSRVAPPLEIEISASNGASDYGNKFGEPIILGFTRSFGMEVHGERREYLKPIMFTGGIGQMDHTHIKKGDPSVGMIVVKLGGPAYRVGIGGGAASSLTQGANDRSKDFAAVQRGDAEMESKVNRVIRSCVALGDRNPIVTIHDQGAGGNANVLKEIVNPAGAKIELQKILVADETLSVLEIWCAEYQESDAILIHKKDAQIFQGICEREGAPFSFVGEITGDGRITLVDEKTGTKPVDLELSKVLADMPKKTFHSNRIKKPLKELQLPTDLTVMGALDRVLRLLNVGSKRFLTTKVDRAVSGLIAQQQCVGPLHIPLSDYASVAHSHFNKTGAVTSIGEQPIKGLINPAAMARMTVGESLTNIVFAAIDGGLEHIKASGNWMWAAKLPGEGAEMYDACKALSETLIELKVAIDGGKDSLSMAAKVEDKMVKAPGTLVMSLYAPMKDITRKVRANIDYPGLSSLILIDMGLGKLRIGGSAFVQVFSQVGSTSPDMDSPKDFANYWNLIQQLIFSGLIVSGHDRSDGGLIVTLLEMAFTGDCGFELQLPINENLFEYLFAEELGVVIEVKNEKVKEVLSMLEKNAIYHTLLGKTTTDKNINMTDKSGKIILDAKMTELRDIWEATSFELDKLQANSDCVKMEKNGLKNRFAPKWKLSFRPELNIPGISSKRPPVAIIREEGSHGDREMGAAFYMAGFEVWDVKMSDLKSDNFSLAPFKGIAFVGGFSYADVMDSAKGWAGTIVHNPKLMKEFQTFYQREDTFTLGICNGCQLMALLGWVPFSGTPTVNQPRFIHNTSERFESRFVSVTILDSPSVLLKGMAGSTLGVWVQHGEGKAYFPDKKIFQSTLSQNLAPVRYTNDNGDITEEYPHNPNGSIEGIAALCSPDGRHLAMMPHPERTFVKWHYPWMPHEWEQFEVSPWLKMFQNARVWVESKI